MGNIYIGDNGIARKVNKIYVGVNGIARQVQKAYVGDSNGIAREVYSAYTPIIYGGTIRYTDDLPANSYYTVTHYLNNYFVITPSMIREAKARGYTKIYLDYTATWTQNSSSSGEIYLIDQAESIFGTFTGYHTGNVNLPNLNVAIPNYVNSDLKISYYVFGTSSGASRCTTTVSNVRFGV